MSEARPLAESPEQLRTTMAPGAMAEAIRGQTGDEERLSVCKDVLLLLTVDELKNECSAITGSTNGFRA